ncbi:uncharacterized protein PHACADRAFT_92806, partial [Phanerochaete carnosa HHB-10118-sp]
HRGIICRACEEPIFGVRHKCIECSDFDLCKACISLVPIRSQHEHTHTFFPIEYPWDQRPFFEVSTVSCEVYPDIECDGCGQHPVFGVLYRCSSCDEFDFCSACFNSAEERSEHDISHDFFPIQTSLEHGPASSSDHEGTTDKTSCDGCQRRIYRIRHRCLECTGFSLCRLCISSVRRRSEHDPKHRFFPIEYPWDAGAFDAVYATLDATRCRGCNLGTSAAQHRCLSCLDFVFCMWCISDPDVRAQHDLTHPFFPYTTHFEDLDAIYEARRQQFATYKDTPLLADSNSESDGSTDSVSVSLAPQNIYTYIMLISSRASLQMNLCRCVQ